MRRELEKLLFLLIALLFLFAGLRLTRLEKRVTAIEQQLRQR